MDTEKDQNYSVIRFAQYLSGLNVQQNLWRETAKALINFFGADVVAFGERSVNGRLRVDHWTFASLDVEETLAECLEAFRKHTFEKSAMAREIGKAMGETLESGFFASRYFSAPEEVAMAFLPVVVKNQIHSVMLTGHRKVKSFPNKILDAYLAVAGLVGTTRARLASELDLRNHRDHLEELVKERTARLTESNQRLHQEITHRKKVEAELVQERDNLIRIFEAMEDRIYIVNSSYDILYMNPAFEKDFSPVAGSKCYEILNGTDEMCSWCNIETVLSGSTARHEWFSACNGKTYDMVETPVKHASGSVHMLTLFRDITERKEAREMLKARNKELQTALKRVRQLSGLLPICANCKQIRDNAGYWHDVTSYIRDHSEAEFSHSICPECLKKLYPEFVQE